MPWILIQRENVSVPEINPLLNLSSKSPPQISTKKHGKKKIVDLHPTPPYIAPNHPPIAQPFKPVIYSHQTWSRNCSHHRHLQHTTHSRKILQDRLVFVLREVWTVRRYRLVRALFRSQVAILHHRLAALVSVLVQGPSRHCQDWLQILMEMKFRQMHYGQRLRGSWFRLRFWTRMVDVMKLAQNL